MSKSDIQRAARESENRETPPLGSDLGMSAIGAMGIDIVVYRREVRSDWYDGPMEILLDGCEDLTGYPAEAFSRGTISYWDCIEPEDRENVRESLKLAAATSRPIQLEYRIRTKNGEQKWIWERTVFLRGGEDQPPCIQGFMTDISERRRAELELRHGNRLLGGLSLVQSLLLQGLPSYSVFSEMLAVLLDVTQSEAGFLAEVIHKPGSRPFLRTWALSERHATSEQKRNLAELVANGMEFHNLDSLYGDVVTSGRTVLSDNPLRDPRRAGLPMDHFEQFEACSFMGIPIYFRDKLIGMAGLANRPGGYSEDMNGWLEPYLMGFAAALNAYYAREKQLQAERSLRESEQRYASLAAMAPVGILHVDARGECVFVNEKLCEMARRSKDELLGMGYRDIVHPSHRDAVLSELLNVLQGRPSFSGEVSILGPDDKAVWVLIHAAPQRQNGARDLGAIVTFTDISERRHWEFVLRSIVEGLAGKTGRLYIDSLVLQVARLLEIDYVGLSTLVPEIPGRARTLAFCELGEIQPHFEYTVVGTPSEGVYAGEACAYVRGVQGVFPLDTSLVEMGIEGYVGAPLFDADRRVLGVLFVMHRKPIERVHFVQDILGIFASRAGAELYRMAVEQKIKALNRDLEQRVSARTSELSAATAELSRAARLKDEFLATMSHELRTPLNAILGMSEALLDDLYGSLDKRQIKPVRSIFESGRHLLSLINDILDISKMEAGSIGLEIAPTAVAPACDASVRLVREQAQKKGIKINTEIDGGVSIVWADARRLKQILVNLLSNAVKFTPEGGTIGLSVSLDAARDAICFSVWDTGIGIEASELNRIFEPFVQIDSRLAREYGGTGLGLSLVRRLADAHGGSVSAESARGQGSRFWVRLPLPPPDEPSSVSRQDGDRDSSFEMSAPSQILLSSENEMTIQALTAYLQAKAYDVRLSRDSDETLVSALENKPSLIVVDLQGSHGLRAIEKIRAGAGLKDIPLIALLALSVPGDEERCLSAGADAYFIKPVPGRILAEAIESLLLKA